MESEYNNLINKLFTEGHIKLPAILQAFQERDRALFLPIDQVPFVGEDRPLPIGYGQTISQPYTVAFILHLVDPKQGDNILDIGTGSGWQAALLASLVAPDGKVVTVECIKELAESAKENLEKFSLITNGSVVAIHGNALEIDPLWPVFDKIIVAAEHTSIPDAWKNALAVGGRIVMPILGRIVVADKISGDNFDIKEYPGFSFVPLMSK